MMRIAIKPDVVGIGHATIDPQNRAECARMDKRGGDAHLDALADLAALGGHGRLSELQQEAVERRIQAIACTESHLARPSVSAG